MCDVLIRHFEDTVIAVLSPSQALKLISPFGIKS